MDSPPLPRPAREGFFAIVLAAGEGRRMGLPKGRLPWLAGMQLLPWTLQELKASGWEPVVVLNPVDFAHWAPLLPGERLVENPQPERGKASSLVTGLRAAPESAARFLFTAIDQPRPREIYRQLRDEAAAIVVPEHGASRGHPVAASGAFREELLRAADDSLGLRGFLDRHRGETVRVPVGDPAWLAWDLNTPAEYEAALAFFRKRLS